MAPSILSPLSTHMDAPFRSKRIPSSRHVSGAHDGDSVSTVGVGLSMQSSRVASRKYHAVTTTNISSVVSSLQRRSGDELGASASSQLLSATHASILEWIRTQRLSLLPPEGSDYDKVLAWAQLFVERLHSFDLAIEQFAGDSYLAAQLAYGYCAMLLELGRENAAALMVSFGFFYGISVSLVNLLERTELFTVTQEIQEQLILALSDLVTLVASVSTHFHKAIRGMTTASVSVNIYRTFPSQIQAFQQRCEKISESMWRHQFLRENLDGERVAEVRAIRAWLAPEDRAVARLADTTSHLAHDREELTCLWMGPYLARFLKTNQKHLCITGPPGSGKTVLASVIVDQLQHPHGGVSYQTLLVPINSKIPAQTRPHAIAKAILSQLFDKRIGNVQLFRILSDALHRSRATADYDTFESILWEAVEQALPCALRGAKDLVLVVDGLDEASFSEEALLQRLTTVASKALNTKLITLGSHRPAATAGQTRVQINDDLIFDDIAAVVRSSLASSPVFSTLPSLEQETLIERITQASKSSFLWAKLIAKRARQEQQPDSFRKTVESLISSKLTITGFTLQTLEHAEVSTQAKLMLLWLATANRPLHIRELAALASIQTDKQTVSETRVDPLQILRPVNSLVFLENEFFYLRHALIRAAILEAFAQGKLVPGVKDRHLDLTTRLLIYVKHHVTEQHEPSSIPALDHHDTVALLDRHVLLDFALRYWILHFRQTALFAKDGGDTVASKELVKLLPSVTTVVLLQRSVWETTPTPDVLLYQTSVTNIYRHVLKTDNVVTLQTIISLANIYRQVDRVPDSITLFHEAALLSQKLLSARHIVTMQMVSTFIEITASLVSETKTEVMVRREQMLLLQIECFKLHYGNTSDKVVTVMKQLVEHYQLVKETEKAQTIITTIQSITSSSSSTEYGGTGTNGASGSLHVHLVGRGEKEAALDAGYVLNLDVQEEDEAIETTTTTTTTESYDVEALIKLAAKYLQEGKVVLAERLYVEYWQRATRESRVHSSARWEENKLKVIIAYSNYLRAQKREYEASSVLSTFWQDYAQHTSASLSETSVSYLQEIAKVMKTVGLATTALTVFKHCSEYFRSSRRTETSLYQEIQQSITTTSKEVMQSASTSTTTVVSESTLEEMIFESSTSITTVDQTFYGSTETLVSLYISQRRWQHATQVIKRILHNIWPALFAPILQDVTLPEKDVDSCVALAERLAQCYHSRRRLSKEQDIRLRLYHAVRSSGRNVQDKLRQHVVAELLRLLERTSQTETIITVHQELLNDYTKHHGPGHATVIATLWTLARLTRPRPIFLDYYQQIIQALNNKDATQPCHPDALEPLNIVATELWNQGRYSESQHYLAILFAAFRDQPKLSAKFQDAAFVQDIFNRYTQCLRAVRAEFSVLHQVTVEYHARCKAVFGAAVSITVQATLTLAQLCQESKQYEIEAIRLYEELLQVKSTEIAIEYEEISATLDALYEEQSVSIARTEKTESVSASQVEQTVRVLKKRVTSLRETYGWAHEESLAKTQEIISFHAKRGKTELVVQELQEATVNILSSSETSATRLSSAATTIVSGYLANKQVQRATELAEEVYRQIIVGDATNVATSRFDLTAKSRESLIFLAQLEHHLRRQTSSSTVTEILASLSTELVYFEEFHREIRAKTGGVVLYAATSSAARLYQFLVANGRQSIAARVFNEFTSFFSASTEGKRAGLKASQLTVFVSTLLAHFSAHQSHDLVRSVGIASNAHVLRLLASQKYDQACDLALAAFRFISAQDAYRTPAIAKFVLALGINISSSSSTTTTQATRKKLLSVSATILPDVLTLLLSNRQINIARIGLPHLNTLISLLGAQKDYRTLSLLLTSLWTSREAQRTWDPYVTFSLARLYILARYLTGEGAAAIRLAEDIVYNCRRVHGARHPSTLQSSVLLSQLYTGIGARYSAHKESADLANRYYKKSAALHENILRAFSDPTAGEFEGGNLDQSLTLSLDGSAFEVDLAAAEAAGVSAGEQVRRHLGLFKLSVQRLGAWPKEVGEYERLVGELVRAYPEELAGVAGVEKWDLKAFGGGKAEGSEDLVDVQDGDWRLLRGEVEDVDEEL